MNPVTIKPSQWINIGYFIFAVIGFYFILPPIFFLYKLIEVSFWRYEFHEKSLIERKGVFSVERKELLYSRIKSIRREEPLLYRLVGLSNVYIISSDPFMPEIKLTAVRNGMNIWQSLRTINETERKRNGVREFDLYNLNK